MFMLNLCITQVKKNCNWTKRYWYGRWISIYLYNQCISPVRLESLTPYPWWSVLVIIIYFSVMNKRSLVFLGTFFSISIKLKYCWKKNEKQKYNTVGAVILIPILSNLIEGQFYKIIVIVISL